MRVQVIIPAAGTGTRIKSDIPKPLISLNDKPVIVHTLEVFESIDVIAGIVLVTRQEDLPEFEKVVKKYKLKKVDRIIPGGATRSSSVAKGLAFLDKHTDVVLVHDGVRPLLTHKLIEKMVDLCKNHEAVAAGVPVTSTIKRVDPQTGEVLETVERNGLWEIQTPQIFRREILEKAHAEKKDDTATDDALLVENLGVKVVIAESSYENIKITTQENLIIARAFLTERQRKQNI